MHIDLALIYPLVPQGAAPDENSQPTQLSLLFPIPTGHNAAFYARQVTTQLTDSLRAATSLKVSALDSSGSFKYGFRIGSENRVIIAGKGRQPVTLDQRQKVVEYLFRPEIDDSQ